MTDFDFQLNNFMFYCSTKNFPNKNESLELYESFGDTYVSDSKYLKECLKRIEKKLVRVFLLG